VTSVGAGGSAAGESAAGAQPGGDDSPGGTPTDPPRPARQTSFAAELEELPPRPRLALPRWLAPLAVVCVVVLLPWIGYLAVTLPRRARADHYDLAWIGFDCAMWAVLAALAFCAVRRLTATGPVAAVAATMLCVDAWFDVVTTHNRREFAISVLSAVFAEIPLAIVCAWVAINAERIRLRAYHRLRLQWQRAITLAGAVDGQGVTETVTRSVTVTESVTGTPPAQ